MNENIIKLTDDELFEAEKALDTYASFIHQNLSQACDIATRYSALTPECDTPLDNTITALGSAQKKIKAIRDKFKTVRLSTTKSKEDKKC